ncbi:hypothetical protein ACJMK2_015560, partial [Sinanodonta woodiana]
VTRAMKRRSLSRPLRSVTSPIDILVPGEFGKLQREDMSLDNVRRYATDGSVKKLPDGEVKFATKRGILYRYAKKGANTFKQVVVPVGKRDEVLRIAHEGLLGSHMGVAKTGDRLVREFYWPGVHVDVRRYCLSCDKCQRMAPKTSHRPVGPIKPAAESGNRYILTFKKVVVPVGKRDEVLRLAHEGLFGSHMGVAKTRDRLVREFYWPGVHVDVRRYCLSCDKCQQMAPKTSHRPVGPIKPAAESGNRYILTFKQVVVPVGKRDEVLRIAHEGLLGSHMGVAKTGDRL